MVAYGEFNCGLKPHSILTNLHAQNILSSLCIAYCKLKDKMSILFFKMAFNGKMGFADYPNCISSYELTHNNLHGKYHINLSMYAESKINTNVHYFHAKTAC